MRYVRGREFPPYAFLPGRNAHPTRDPEGHSFGPREQAAPYLPPARWRENEPYLWGVDLYNHGYLWESHEAWEGLWHSARQDALQADHLQGLIQCAAACLKIPMGQPRGLERLARLATDKLLVVAHECGGEFMGVKLFDLVEAMLGFAERAPTSIEGRPRIELEGV